MHEKVTSVVSYFYAWKSNFSF